MRRFFLRDLFLYVFQISLHYIIGRLLLRIFRFFRCLVWIYFLTILFLFFRHILLRLF